MKYVSKSDAIAISTYLAKKYASLGIKDISVDVNGNIVITYADDTTSTISGDLFMVKSVYDVYNRGKVDLAQNSERLAGELAAYYTDSNNILYDNTLSGLTADDVKAALDELAYMVNNIPQPPLSAGVVTTPTFTDNGNGTITIGDAEVNLFIAADFNDEIQRFNVTGGTFTPTNNANSYLVVDYNNGNPIYKIIETTAGINESTIVPVYSFYRIDNMVMYLNWDNLGIGLSNKLHQRFVFTRRFERESGLGLSEMPTRVVNIGAGVVWYGAVRNYLDAVVSNIDICHLHYHVSGIYTFSDTNQYNNTYYDDGTDLIELTNNYYTVNWIYRNVEDEKHMEILLGDQQYNQLSLAIEAQPRPDLPDLIKSNCVLVGRIIVQKDATVAANIASAFDVTFVSVPINNHNYLGGLDGGLAGEYFHLTFDEYDHLEDFSNIKRYGFVDRAETSLSFDGVNTLTLIDNGGGWSYFRNGKMFTVTGNKTVNLTSTPPAAKGKYYIFIDDEVGTLSVSQTAWTLNDTKVVVAVIAWDNALTPKFQLSDERHTALWDRQSHRYHHLVDGTKLIAGSELTGYVLNSATNTNKVFGITEAAIADEDIFLTLSAFAKPNAVDNVYTILYRNPSLQWIWNLSPMPFKYTSTGFVEYDNNGVLTPITVNNFTNTYLLVSNIQGRSRFMFVVGQSAFSNAASAYAERFETYNLTNFVTAESVALYQLTWRGQNNAGLGQCVLDRVQKISVNIVATNIVANPSHNSLNDLQGGTTNEYYHLTATQHTDLLATRFWALLGTPANLGVTAEYQKILNTDTTKIPDATSNYFTLSTDKKDITCIKSGVVRITRTVTVSSLSAGIDLFLIPTINGTQTAQCISQEQQRAVTTTTKDIGYSYYLSVNAGDVISLWVKGSDASTLTYVNARTTVEYI
jgi:hypothetical protein